jgi:type I restriction enzyme M protein
MPIKKSELYSSLWQSCDESRGGMDASQYKDYALSMMQELLTGRTRLV